MSLRLDGLFLDYSRNRISDEVFAALLQLTETQAIIPYDQAMHQFPSFLQQLDMKSNGKSVDLEGNAIAYATGPIVWGETGSNGSCLLAVAASGDAVCADRFHREAACR